MVERERELRRLLAGLAPTLSQERYAFEATDCTTINADEFALIREEEGVTVIRPDPAGEWARISLGVESSLKAVGLTAAFSTALTDAGISANVVAALHHDHIFVQWHSRDDALRVLRALA